MSQESAQRELEQKALRNVRGLVDKIERTDELESRQQKRAVFIVLVICVAVAVALGVMISQRTKTVDVVIDPAKLPPVKAGPQR